MSPLLACFGLLLHNSISDKWLIELDWITHFVQELLKIDCELFGNSHHCLLTLALSIPAMNTIYNSNKDTQKWMKIWRDKPVRNFLGSKTIFIKQSSNQKDRPSACSSYTLRNYNIY